MNNLEKLEKKNLEIFQNITEEESTEINGGFTIFDFITVWSYVDSKWDDWKSNFKRGQNRYNY